MVGSRVDFSLLRRWICSVGTGPYLRRLVIAAVGTSRDPGDCLASTSSLLVAPLLSLPLSLYRLDAATTMTTLHRSSSPAPSATSTLRSVLSQAELASTSAKRPLEEPSDETLRVEERAQVAELPRDGACQEDAVTLPKSGGRVKRGLKAVWDLLRAQVRPKNCLLLRKANAGPFIVVRSRRRGCHCSRVASPLFLALKRFR